VYYCGLIEQQRDDTIALENQDQDAYFNFINSLKSPVTKETYKVHINYYLKFCNCTKLSKLLTIQEPQKQIIKYIRRRILCFEFQYLRIRNEMSCMQFGSKRTVQSQSRNRRVQMLWMSSYKSRSQSEETGETGE
jgi:hypothetical protein